MTLRIGAALLALSLWTTSAAAQYQPYGADKLPALQEPSGEVRDGDDDDLMQIAHRGGYYRGGYVARGYYGGYRGYFGGYRGFYYGGYRGFYGYRPYYYRGWYPRSYVGVGFYRPYWYYPRYWAYPRYYYGGVYYTYPSYYYPSYYSYYPCTAGVTVTYSSPSYQTLPPMPRADEKVPPAPLDEEGGYRYDGGPTNPVPMPKADPSDTKDPPVKLRVVSTSAPSTRLPYPAYGEK